MFSTIEGTFPNLPIANVGAHMHLIGTQMELWIERSDPDAGGPDTECLLPVSRYDYDWQQLYRYDAALADMPAISGGDAIRMRCTYDNTLENPGTRRALVDAGEDAPVDIYLGEGTLDEMCIAMLGVVYRGQGRRRPPRLATPHRQREAAAVPRPGGRTGSAWA